MTLRIGILVLVLVATACSSDETTGTQELPVPTVPESTTTIDGDEESTTTTDTTVITGNAAFVIEGMTFGDEATIAVGNLGPDPGDLTGYWLAIHPFYLELPSAVVHPDETLVISISPDADPDIVLPANGLLPPLSASSGEIGLYASGEFGNPASIVDYVEWGTAGHARTGIAVAAEIWPEGETVATDGASSGLVAEDRSTNGPAGWTIVSG